MDGARDKRIGNAFAYVRGTIWEIRRLRREYGGANLKCVCRGMSFLFQSSG